MAMKDYIKSDNENGVIYQRIALRSAIVQVMNGCEKKVQLDGITNRMIIDAVLDFGLKEKMKVETSLKTGMVLYGIGNNIVIALNVDEGLVLITSE